MLAVRVDHLGEVRVDLAQALVDSSAIRRVFSGPSGDARVSSAATMSSDQRLSAEIVRIDAEQLRDHPHREGRGHVRHQVEREAGLDHAVDELAGDGEDARLHGRRDPRGGEHLTEERAQAGVIGRVVAEERAEPLGARGLGHEVGARREGPRIAEERVDVVEAEHAEDAPRQDPADGTAGAGLGEHADGVIDELRASVVHDWEVREGCGERVHGGSV